VPLSRVMRRVSQVRDERYGLLRGLFHGRDTEDDSSDAAARLHSVTLEPGAGAIGRSLAELELGAEVKAVRRRGVKAKLGAEEAGSLQAGDVVVLLGSPEALAAAEERLLTP
jgi:monovalent cation:H+ antiporter-2, CPA2 family